MIKFQRCDKVIVLIAVTCLALIILKRLVKSTDRPLLRENGIDVYNYVKFNRSWDEIDTNAMTMIEILDYINWQSDSCKDINEFGGKLEHNLPIPSIVGQKAVSQI